jgi:hypothetical protein
MATDRGIPARLKVRWPVVMLTAKGVLVAETGDITSEGAYIRCKMPLRPREKLRLFIMPPHQRPLELPAEVTWSNPSDTSQNPRFRGMGLRFTGVSGNNRQFLRDILAKHYKKKTGHIPDKK